MSLLDPLWLARLAPLELRARALADSAVSGRHAGRRSGVAGEFLSHRAYVLGDERRRIDWKIYARTDRWVVRESRVETSLNVTLVLDVSHSMSFAGGPRPPKLFSASVLLAAMATLLIQRQESCGLALVNDRLTHRLPVRGGPESLQRLLSLLEQSQADGPTDLSRGLAALRPFLPRRGMVLLASDFLQPPDTWAGALRELTARGHEVIAFQVLDPWELSLDAHGIYDFIDLETGDRLRGEAEVLAARYAAVALKKQEDCARALSSAGVDHVVFKTDDPLDRTLAHYLRGRKDRA